MKNTKLKYKGFIGDAQFSTYDNLYYGSILNTNDLVSYEGNDYNELFNDFKNAVETYIDICADLSHVKLLDPKLFNVSKFFIILRVIEKFFSKENFKKLKDINVKTIFTQGKESCVVWYNKKKHKYDALVKTKNKDINISGDSPKEINKKFKEIIKQQKTKKESRKYILLCQKPLNKF